MWARFGLLQTIYRLELLAKSKFPGPGQSVILVVLLVVLTAVMIIFLGFNVCSSLATASFPFFAAIQSDVCLATDLGFA